MVLYKLIKNIKKELNVKARYCPQCKPIESVPDLSKSDFTKIFKRLYWYYKDIYTIDVYIDNVFKFFLIFWKQLCLFCIF